MGAIFEAIGNFFLSIFVKVSILILKLVRIILNLIFDISNINFFGDDIVSEITTRVYILIGVIMLFKITISCIQYLVSPDKAEDKENGFGGIIKRTIISVLLLAFVPALFDFAKDAQNAILEALPKVILGQERTSNVDDMADTMAYITALAFFDYTSDVCNNQTISRSFQDDSKALFSNIDDISKHSDKIAGEKCSNGEKRYTFKSHLCIPAGLVLVGILLSMVLDVGVRVVKFGFLQLIAPVPIASYIDPKTSKKSFDSWVHNCVTVYADLFIRLGVIYLVLYLFMILLPSFSKPFVLNNGTELPWGRTMLVNVAIIISLFMFAKSAPKFICDVLGIKDTGNLTDMFKRAGGLAGTGLGVGRDGYATYKNKVNKLKKENEGEKLKPGDRAKALKSAFKASGSSLKAGLSSVGHNKGFKDTMNASKRAARKNYDINEALESSGKSMWDYRKESLNRMMGIDSSADFYKNEAEKSRKLSNAAKSSIDSISGLIPAKAANLALDEETARRFMLNATGSADGTLTIGFTADGRERTITAADLIGREIRDANGKVIGYESNVSIGQLMHELESMKTAKASDYFMEYKKDPTRELTKEEEQAEIEKIRQHNDRVQEAFSKVQGSVQYVQDKLNGDVGVFVLNNATDRTRIPNIPAIENTIQHTINAYFEGKNTNFAKRVTAEGIARGWINQAGEPINGHAGDWFNYVKTEGLREESASINKGDPAESIVKDIYDRYSDKK